jgi:hypothetical protein
VLSSQLVQLPPRAASDAGPGDASALYAMPAAAEAAAESRRRGTRALGLLVRPSQAFSLLASSSASRPDPHTWLCSTYACGRMDRDERNVSDVPGIV